LIKEYIIPVFLLLRGVLAVLKETRFFTYTGSRLWPVALTYQQHHIV